MPGNSEFRLTVCVNLPAVFSVRVPSTSYPRLTPYNLSHGCNSQYSVKIKNSQIREKRKPWSAQELLPVKKTAYKAFHTQEKNFTNQSHLPHF